MSVVVLVMKTILAVSIYTVLATGAFAQVGTTRQGSLPEPRSKVSDLAAAGQPHGEAQRFDLIFPGGTVTEFIKQVKANLGENVNVIIPKGSEAALIPPLEVYRVTLRSLFSAVTTASGSRVAFQSEDPPDAPGAIWTFREVGGDVAEVRPQVRYFPIAQYLPRFTVEDITAAIEAGWALQNSNRGSNAVVKFHEETRLLICAASSEQLAIIPQVLAGLDEVPFPKSHKIIERASRMRIPRLEFRDATLAEAIEFIKRKSIELDPDLHRSIELDPDERPEGGINIIFNEDTSVAGRRVTLVLTNVTVLDALRTVVSISGLDLQVTDVAVVLNAGAEHGGPSREVDAVKPAKGGLGSTEAQTPKPGAPAGVSQGSVLPPGHEPQPSAPPAK